MERILNECGKLGKNEYKTRHDSEGNAILWKLSMKVNSQSNPS